jgi:hypothetical protein
VPGTSRRIYALSVHADYACRDSGACCTAGWAIPVEPSRQKYLGAEVLVPADDGACRYYDRERRLCRVQRDHGREQMPASCQQFPRRALVDGRGVFVTLSHFCPSAADLLFRTDRPLSIEEAPPAFPVDREYEGLDARDEWPPLVRPGLLFDGPSYDAWEHFLVEALGHRETTPRAALARIASAAEYVRGWTPACGPLLDRIRLAGTAAAADDAALRLYRAFDRPEAYLQVARMVPFGLTAPTLPVDPDVCGPDLPAVWNGAVSAYLASKAFASWCAYQAHGVRTLVAELVLTLLILRLEARRAGGGGPLGKQQLLAAIRASDWLLVHLSDRDALMAWLGAVERA